VRTEPEHIQVYTNYFELISNPNWTLYQYHVDFEPAVESKRLRMGLIKEHETLFANNKAFDGTTLFSLTKLDNPVNLFFFNLRKPLNMMYFY
jgi:aubergine-like protein